MTIEQTTDYDIFKSFISNREVDPKHVKRLARSLKRRNLMYLKPVLVNSGMYVIDGQHRVEACRLISEPVYYLKTDSLTRTDIAILNTAQLNWRQLDFINFYAIEGVREFQEFCKLVNTFPEMRISALIRLCEKGGKSKPREGILNIGNIGNTRKVCERIKELAASGYEFVYSRGFSIAFARVITGATFSTLLDRINTNNFHWCGSETEYRRMLEHILKA